MTRKVILGLALLAIGCSREPEPKPVPIAPRPEQAAAPVDPVIEFNRRQQERDQKAEQEQDRKEEILRAASKLMNRKANEVVRDGYKILESKPCLRNPNRIGFLVLAKLREGFVADPENHQPDAFFVEGDKISKESLSQDLYYWETEGPEDLALRWATWFLRFDGGTCRVKSVKQTLNPPTLDAVVIRKETGERFRLQLLSFGPDGSANFEWKSIDGL
jgi:hypothetical protein